MPNKTDPKRKRRIQHAPAYPSERLWYGERDREGLPLITTQDSVKHGPKGPLKGIDENSEIVARCLELIGPARDKKRACRADIVRSINWVEILHKSQKPSWYASSSEKRQLKKLADALDKASRTLKDIECWYILFRQFGKPSPELRYARPVVVVDRQEYEKFCDVLSSIKAQAKERANNLVVHKGGPLVDLVKLNAAGNALQLLLDFGASPPTQTIGGPFYELASLLYEGATDKEGRDLSRSCKTYIAMRAEGHMR
jgi:hypothetical protein